MKYNTYTAMKKFIYHIKQTCEVVVNVFNAGTCNQQVTSSTPSQTEVTKQLVQCSFNVHNEVSSHTIQLATSHKAVMFYSSRSNHCSCNTLAMYHRLSAIHTNSSRSMEQRQSSHNAHAQMLQSIRGHLYILQCKQCRLFQFTHHGVYMGYIV